ncbi:nucleotide excision repair endonuclease, partial [bacterium]|nr:nucleotide excision repair endonuclease [bacterium]
MREGAEIRRSSPNTGSNLGTSNNNGIESPNRVTLVQALKLSPQNPGAYRFWDTNDNVFYVGKAKNLKNRIHSHLNNPNENPRHGLFISRSQTIDWIVTPNEIEALLLEDMLIKRHKPA